MIETGATNNTKRITDLLLLLCLVAGVVLHANGQQQNLTTGDARTVSEAEPQETVQTHTGLSISERSKKGLYQVTLQSDDKPLPLNRMNSWTARIATTEGRVVDDAIVMVYGGMPEHKHGFPSKPRVTAGLGDGRYRIEGVKFNMPGRWEMWINVRSQGRDDKVIFGFEVP